jgi:hypothetical protein
MFLDEQANRRYLTGSIEIGFQNSQTVRRIDVVHDDLVVDDQPDINPILPWKQRQRWNFAYHSLNARPLSPVSIRFEAGAGGENDLPVEVNEVYSRIKSIGRLLQFEFDVTL